VFGLTLTLPWTLHYSTHIVNPSDVLAGAVLFWIGVGEALDFGDRLLTGRATRESAHTLR
jgi:hypothetical protein